MPKLNNIKKVLVIGSGPIIIGQAAEFDYAGTQACRALKEEGLEVVLVNSNPATIMTDVHVADRVYVEPIDIEFLEKVIKRERPDSLLATLGRCRPEYMPDERSADSLFPCRNHKQPQWFQRWYFPESAG